MDYLEKTISPDDSQRTDFLTIILVLSTRREMKI